MKHLILIFFNMIVISCSAQMDNRIYYIIPENVNNLIEEHLRGLREEDNNNRFALYFIETDNNKYALSVVNYKKERKKSGFDLLIEEIIEKSNRYIKVGEYHVPMFYTEDIVFADVGETIMTDGRVAKKRILFNNDGLTITFDKSGTIYDN